MQRFAEKASDECSEGSAIWERSSTFRCNSVSSWNSLQNEFTSTPYHNLPVRRGNELYGPHFDSFRCFSQSQTFLTKICDKEVIFFKMKNQLSTVFFFTAYRLIWVYLIPLDLKAKKNSFVFLIAY